MSSVTSLTRPSDPRGDLGQGRLDRLARPAPRRPELDDHGHLAREHLCREGRVRHLCRGAHPESVTHLPSRDPRRALTCGRVGCKASATVAMYVVRGSRGPWCS